jgi:hypothetical protein
MAPTKQGADFIQTIHEENKKAKLQAKTVLKQAKKDERIKIKNGYRYVQLSKDTWVLRKQE